MAKILLPANNSTGGVHVNPRGPNTYKYVYDFDDLATKIAFVEKELLNDVKIADAFAKLPDVKSMINTRNTPLMMTFNVKKADYPNQKLDWFLGKDICILELEGLYYFYAIKSIKGDSFDAFTYTAELDIFFTYGERKFFKDKTDIFIKRAHADRGLKNPAQGFFLPNLALDSPATSNEDFQQHDLQYNLINPVNNFDYGGLFIKYYQPKGKIVDEKIGRNSIKFRLIPYAAQNPYYGKTPPKTGNDDPSAQPKYIFNKPLINYLNYNYAYFLALNFNIFKKLQFIDENDVIRNVSDIELYMTTDGGKTLIEADDVYSLSNALTEQNLGNVPYTVQNNNALANGEFKKNIPTMCVSDSGVIPPILGNNRAVRVNYDTSSQHESLQIIIDVSQSTNLFYVQTSEKIYGISENDNYNMLNVYTLDNEALTLPNSQDIVHSKDYVLSPPNDVDDDNLYQYESKLLISPYSYVSCFNFYSEIKYNIALLAQNGSVTTDDLLSLQINFNIQENYELKNRAIYLSINESYYNQGNFLQSNFNNQHGEYLPTYNYAYTDFLLNNNQNLQNQYNKLSYDQNYAMTAGTVAGALEIVAGVLALFTGAGSLAGLGLIAGGFATGIETGQKAGDYAFEKQGIKAEYQDASMAPHTIEATVSSRVIASRNGLYAPNFRLKTLTSYAQKTIATYFIKNGYNGNILVDYNKMNVQKSRYWYNYVQASGVFENIALQVTNEVKEIIEASYKIGITFYHVRKKKDGTLDYVSIKDYSKNNLEMSLYEPPSN